ncbi:unnamed protein product [Urochloa decumbens]|uniref:BURP domain-containing protein n=1 Tax=Urochloa decumbens TaxID=240449 RepID=A0ABC8W9P9_9POAL
MHPLAVLLIFVTASAASAVYGHPAATDTPAARFWEKALPGTPMPEAIADLVQEGIDDSPLEKHYCSSPDNNNNLRITAGGPPNTPTLRINYHHVSASLAKAVLPAGIFFQESQMRVGSTMTVSFPPASVPPILPRDVADKVPFRNLADVLATFHIPPSSAKATMARDTLNQCTAASSLAAGEQMACATSLEATVGGATRMLVGSTHHQQGAVYWAASSALPRAGLPLRPYAVAAVTQLAGDRHVGCHSLPYPYAVYYCHMTGKPTKAYAVALRGAAEVSMAAICHVDTSDWDLAHPAFKMLHTRPGGAPVCHFMSYASLVFGEKAANA